MKEHQTLTKDEDQGHMEENIPSFQEDTKK